MIVKKAMFKIERGTEVEILFRQRENSPPTLRDFVSVGDAKLEDDLIVTGDDHLLTMTCECCGKDTLFFRHRWFGNFAVMEQDLRPHPAQQVWLA